MKLKVFSLIGILFVFGSAQAAENQNAALAQTLSALYGAPVAVEIGKDACQIKYSKVDIKDETVEFVPSATDADELTAKTKTEITTIPETVLTCKQSGDFYGMPQYKVINKTPMNFIARLYNLSTLAFLKDLDIKSFHEEMLLVPDLGMVSSDKLQLKDVSYTEKDPTTGLKSELGNLQDFIMEQKISKNGDKLKFRVDTQMNMLNFALPIFSMQIKSERQAAEFEYKYVPDKLNFSQMMSNFEHLLFSKSLATVRGVKIESDMFGAGLTFDVDVEGKIELEESGLFDMHGESAMKNMVFSGDLLDKSKQIKSVDVKYAFNGIRPQNFAQLSRWQEQIAESENEDEMPDIDEEQVAKVMDEIVDKANMLADMSFKFADGEVAVHADLKRKNGYLFGETQIKVTNLYGIFPEQKKCLSDPAAEECGKDSLFTSLQEYIDVFANDSITVFRYDETGIYKGKEKIGEPIEIDFQKMMQDDNEDGVLEIEQEEEDIDIDIDEEPEEEADEDVSA